MKSFEGSPITTAIIPVAGQGTRMFPVTATIEKAMLPIGTRPVVDYIVDNCADAGLTDVIFVVSEGSSQIQSHFAPKPELIETLWAKRRSKEAESLRAIGRGMRISFVEQDPSRYGTAVPIWNAIDQVDAEQFVVLMGDDFLRRADGGSDLKDLMELVQTNGYAHGLLGNTVPDSEVSNYGILETDENGFLRYITEKPKPEDVLSRMANLSKMILSKSIVAPLLQAYMSQSRAGEDMLTDVITMAAASSPMPVMPIKGEHLDAGTVSGMANCWQKLVIEPLAANV